MRRKINILFVEDDENVLQINTDLLESDDCAIYPAKSISAARKFLKKAMPDIAIIDITLPDDNGLDFASELNQLCSAYIIFLTGKTDKEDQLAGLESGAISYIPKPYDPRTLKLTVQNLIAQIRKTGVPKSKSGSFLLTDGDKEVVRMAISGQSTRAIAATLNVTKWAIKTRMNKIYKKLNISGKGVEKREALKEVVGKYL